MSERIREIEHQVNVLDRLLGSIHGCRTTSQNAGMINELARIDAGVSEKLKPFFERNEDDTRLIETSINGVLKSLNHEVEHIEAELESELSSISVWETRFIITPPMESLKYRLDGDVYKLERYQPSLEVIEMLGGAKRLIPVLVGHGASGAVGMPVRCHDLRFPFIVSTEKPAFYTQGEYDTVDTAIPGYESVAGAEYTFFSLRSDADVVRDLFIDVTRHVFGKMRTSGRAESYIKEVELLRKLDEGIYSKGKQIGHGYVLGSRDPEAIDWTYEEIAEALLVVSEQGTCRSRKS